MKPDPQRQILAAIARTNLAALQRLLASQPRNPLHGAHGRIYLKCAIEQRWPAGVRLLLERGADPNITDQAMCDPPLIAAASRKNGVRIIQLLTSHGARLDLRDASKNTALMMASAGGHLSNVRALHQRGAKVNLKNQNGESALSYAVAWRRTAVAAYLIQNGADVNARDRKGATPLMFADNYGMIDIVAQLIHAGADARAKDNFGNDVLLHAVWSKNNQVVALVKTSRQT